MRFNVGDIVYYYENWSDSIVKAKIKKTYQTRMFSKNCADMEDVAEVCDISAVGYEGDEIVSLPGGTCDRRFKDLYLTAQDAYDAYEKKQHKVIDEYCKEITNVEKLIAFPLKYVLNGGEYIDQAAVTAYKIMAKKLVGIDL